MDDSLYFYHWQNEELRRPSMMDENPFAWLVVINGLVVDARKLSQGIQKELARRGLTPFVPSEEKEQEKNSWILHHPNIDAALCSAARRICNLEDNCVLSFAYLRIFLCE